MNCKAGDLAIIIRGLHGESRNAGKIVKVIDLAFKKTRVGPVWNIEFTRPVHIASYKANLDRLDHERVGVRCHCADAWLRPIRPDEEPMFDHEEIAELTPLVLEPA